MHIKIMGHLTGSVILDIVQFLKCCVLKKTEDDGQDSE
jgi:hypothetical protein